MNFRDWLTCNQTNNAGRTVPARPTDNKMENIIYSRTLINAGDSRDGESPTRIVATEERNGFGVFVECSYTAGTEILKWFEPHERNKAIEYAVKEAPTCERVKEIIAEDLKR